MKSNCQLKRSYASVKFVAIYISVLLLLFTGCTTSTTTAQKGSKAPKWTDYTRRQAIYPSSQYLTGFYAEEGVKRSEETFERMSAVARKQLIESVQVSIKSLAEVQIENVNSKTFERFKQTSTSLAEADIVGLQFETWYDPSNDAAYAFAYAEKAQVIRYYENRITQIISDVNANLGRSQVLMADQDLEGALKAAYASKPLLTEAEKAQALLIALGQTSSAALKTAETQALQVQLDRTQFELLNHAALQVQQLAFVFAFDLKQQVGATEEPIMLQPITYAQYPLESAFSEVLKERLKQRLVSEAGYRVGEIGGGQQKLAISGNFRVEDQHLRIALNLKNLQQNKAIAATEGIIPLQNLQAAGIAWLPDAVAKFELLSQLAMQPEKPRLTAKLQAQLAEPIVVSLVGPPDVPDNLLSGIPIQFVHTSGSGAVIGKDETDSQGSAKCAFGKINKPGVQVISAKVDLAAYTQLRTKPQVLEQLQQAYKVPTAKVVVDVQRLFVLIDADEQNLGQNLTVPFIEPELKESLTKSGFSFTTDASKADMFIKITAHSRKGSSFKGIFFSYVDATVSITDAPTGKEVYTNAFANVKGGGLDYEQAGIKAFRAAAAKVSDEVSKKLLN